MDWTLRRVLILDVHGQTIQANDLEVHAFTHNYKHSTVRNSTATRL